MSWFICGPPVPTFRENIKKWKREITRSIRELQRLAISLQNEERLVAANLKKMALKNRPAARELCKSMIKIQNQTTRVYRAINSMGDLGREMSSAEIIYRTQATVSKSAQIFTALNQAMGVNATRNAMLALGREMEKAGLIDALIESGLNPDDEQLQIQSDEIYDKMIDEMLMDMPVAGSSGLKTAVRAAEKLETLQPQGVSMQTLKPSNNDDLSFPEPVDGPSATEDELNQNEDEMWARFSKLKPPPK